REVEVDEPQADADEHALLRIRENEDAARARGSCVHERVEIRVAADDAVQHDDVVRGRRLRDEVADAPLDPVLDAAPRSSSSKPIAPTPPPTSSTVSPPTSPARSTSVRAVPWTPRSRKSRASLAAKRRLNIRR